VAAFAFYVIQANAAGRPLNTASAFNVLAVLQLAETPVRLLVGTLPDLVSSVSCFARIQDFLLSPSRRDHRMSVGRMSQNSLCDRSAMGSEENIELRSGVNVSHMLTDDSMVLRGFSCGWSKDTPIVHDIDIRVKRAGFVFIIGPVGCGKSTLIKGMLGETPSSEGFVYTSTTSIAFADQEPWNRNSTIRESIRGESNYDESLYQEVIECCGLQHDLGSLPAGDSTVIGSKGISLSGGQKQRLALARAVYARKEILMLDDVFSGLDNDTEEHIFRKLFSKGGLLRRNRTTVVLVTHAIHRLPYSDHVVALDAKGNVSEQGSCTSLCQAGGYVQGLAIRMKTSDEDEKQEAQTVKELAVRTVPINDEDIALNLARRRGDIESYRQYFSASGWWSSGLCLLWSFSFVMSTKSPGLLVKYFTGGEMADASSNNVFMSMLGALAFVSVISLLLTTWQLFFKMVPQASNGLHLSLLETVMRAPLSFFTKTDSGTTLNRFSQDMGLVDNDLPYSFIDTVFNISTVLIIGGLISASASYFLAAIPLTLVALYAIQKYYLRTSRQMRLLDLEAKAPLYSNFQETLSGLASIRAFGWVDKFSERNMELLDGSQRPFYLLFCIQRWLSVVLDLLVAALATILMIIVVQLRHEIDPGLVGLGLLNVISFNSSLTNLVQSWTTMETSIGAIARLRDFVKTTYNEVKPEETIQPAPEWPQKGAFKISNFAASYSESSELILNHISLQIRPGEKFGICGRSGSGKSSLLASLLHLLEYRDGAISVDGQNLAFLPRDLVRQRLNVISQESYWIATESVRFNLNPWADESRAHGDRLFIEALTKCQIWHIIEAKGGLDAKMDAEFLSHGQRQLFCLARAILRKSKVVVLDEVSAK
jgi:ATP-binding cassette, subfamily C (CFTR/MRP), member 1